MSVQSVQRSPRALLDYLQSHAHDLHDEIHDHRVHCRVHVILHDEFGVIHGACVLRCELGNDELAR